MFEDLIKYGGLLECSEDLYQFSDVEFLQDFGPVKQGRKFTGVAFELTNATVKFYETQDQYEDGKESLKFKFKLVAA